MAMTFNFHSVRARRARLRRIFTRTIVIALVASGVGLVLLGMTLLVLGSAVGWFVLGVAVVPLAVAEWVSYGLSHLSPTSGTGFDDLAESEMLAHIAATPTAQQLAEAAMQTTSAQFFAVRFGLAPTFLRDMSSADASSGQAVIDQADVIRVAIGEKVLTGGMIVAALCETQPQLTQLLPHMQVDNDDLASGVRWYQRLTQLIEGGKKPRRTGGIARDWSFGYANTLNRYGINISDRVARGGLLHVRLDSHASALKFMLDTFGNNGRQNITLIGPAGAGKSTVVQAFAESLLAADSAVPDTLKFRQVISLDASSIISAARSRSELETLVNQLLVEAQRAKNIILCLDDAQLFFEDRPGSVDLSSVLMPVIEGGGIRMILTMDEQRYLQISQRSPSLGSLLNRINLSPANEAESLMVMQDQLIMTEFQRKVTFMYQSLREAYRLSERYMHELAQPGKSVRLLEQAAAYAENGLVTAASVAKAIEESSGVKVGRVDTGEERDKLLNLENLIHERMINQTHAVSVVSDALRRARAGVRNESRPIGTFLFLGPTGVGKTELSKALADVYFGGEDRLVRLDLNEYVRSEDVARLITDGAQDPNSLTAQIMKQPFSVVLLDEIEKAHPQVLTTLLQMLDEGILRDINNREVSFRDAIIIATSNAGADTIRTLIDKGFELEQVEEKFISSLIDTQQFRPEFLNRFDEIVLFRPLTQDELVQVVALIIAGVNKTLEPQKISVQLEDAAARKLAAVGYDPRLGARPMRRVVQRSVENLIAKKLLEGTAQPGDIITITENDIQSS
ncbi:MAG: AAA family ATPase [Candidatus Saccharimonadales bacterium]|jgi:ATP-dependent Clp protease ATP-binding subunit ClpC